MTIDKKILDELLKRYQKPEDLLGENGHILNIVSTIQYFLNLVFIDIHHPGDSTDLRCFLC